MIHQLRFGIPVIGGPHWTGGIVYVENLVRALHVLPKSERPALYLVVRQQWEQLDFHKGILSLVSGVLFVGEAAVAMRGPVKPERCFREERDLGEFLDFYFPVNSRSLEGLPAAGWIPDFQHVYLPNFFSAAERQARDRDFSAAANTMRLMVFSSEDAHQHFRIHFPGSKAVTRVLPFHSQAEPGWFDADPCATARKFGLLGKFLICCNQFWIHKNHPLLFQAVSLLREKGLEIPVICTGPTQDYRSRDYFSKIEALLQELKLEDTVRILGNLPRLEQIQLLRRSACVVQPSLFEGWSTVVEDGRMLGKPLLLSDIPVHREQAPFADFFDRSDPRSLADAIERLWPISKAGPDFEKEEIARHEAADMTRRFAQSVAGLAWEAQFIFNRPIRGMSSNLFKILSETSLPADRAEITATQCRDEEPASGALASNLAASKISWAFGNSFPRPVVSAIISTYNSQKFIRGCLENLIGQTLFQKGRLEIIVIDSGSEEDERSIVEEFQKLHPRIRYLRTVRETIYASWNRAIKICNGKYITNANTDDSHRADALEVLSNALEGHGTADLAYGDFITTSVPNDSFAAPHVIRQVRMPCYTPISLLFFCVTGCHPMWRKTVFEQIGFFDPNYESPGDYEFVLRFAAQGHNAVHIKDFLSLYYHNPKGIQFGSWDKSYNDFREIRDKYRRQIPIERLFEIDLNNTQCLADAWTYLGNYSMNHQVPWSDQPCQDMEYAIYCYERALQLLTDNPVALANLILVKLLQGKADECAKLMDGLSPSERDRIEQSVSAGRLELRTGITPVLRCGFEEGSEGGIARTQGMPDLRTLLESADRAEKAGDSQQVRKSLEAALSIAPDQSQIISALGAVYFKLNHFEEASASFRRVTELQPDNIAAWVHLGLSSLRAGNITEFERAVGWALKLEPTNRDALKLLADLNLQNGTLKQAADFYTAIIRNNENDIECLLALGVCFFRIGDVETAKAVFERVLEVEPGNPLATENLEAVRRRISGESKAEHVPQSGDGVRADLLDKSFSNLASIAGCSDPFHGAVALLQRADEAYRNGDLGSARELLMEAARSAPENAEVLSAIGSLSFRVADFTAAEQFLQRAVSLKPDHVPYLVQLAMAQLKAEKIEEFERSLSRALELDPGNREALKFLANLNFESGRFLDAAQTYTELIKRHPDDVESLLALGVCFYKLGDCDMAKAVFERILKVQPDHGVAKENLDVLESKRTGDKGNAQGSGSGQVSAGRSNQSLGNDEGRIIGLKAVLGSSFGDALTRAASMSAAARSSAAQGEAGEVEDGEVGILIQKAEREQAAGNSAVARNLLLRALDLSGENRAVLKLLGEVCFGLGDYDPARQYLRRAVKLGGENVSDWVQLAIAELKANDVLRFEEALGRALRLDPKNYEALRFLADLNREHGNLQDAAQAYLNLLRAHPNDVEAMLAMGDCFIKLNDPITAQKIYREVLDLEPGNSVASENLTKLEKSERRAEEHVEGRGARDEGRLAKGEIPEECVKGDGFRDESGEEQVKLGQKKISELLDQAAFFNDVGNREAAIETLEEALELAPRDGRIVAALGNFYFTTGDYEASRERFRRAIELRPRDPDVYTRLAMTCLQLGRIAEMESALGIALEIDPENREALKFLARTNLENGRVRDAGRLYAKLLEKNASDVDSMLSLGLCFYRGGDIESARMVYRRVLDAEPANLTAQENLAALEKHHGAGKEAVVASKSSGKIKKWLEAAEEAFGSQNLAGARDALKSALELMPDSADILAALGSICFQLGEMPAARDYLERLVKTSPADPEKWVELALAHYQLEEIPEFERALARALDLDPENLEALRLLAHLNFNHGSIADAAQTYGRILKQRPNDLEILLALGVCFFKTGDTEAAKMLFERVLALDPENPLARNNLRAIQGGERAESVSSERSDRNAQTKPGDRTMTPSVRGGTASEESTNELIQPHVAAARQLMASGKVREARDKLREAMRLAPIDDKLIAIIGSLSFQLEDWDACGQELSRAVELCPDSADYQTRLAMVMLKLNRIPEFESALAQALKLEENYRPALKLLADLNLSNGRYEDAARTYHRLLKSNPDDIQVMLPLGVCFFKTDDLEAAKVVFQRILELDPKNAIARQNLRVIDGQDDPPGGGSIPAEPPVKTGPSPGLGSTSSTKPSTPRLVIWEGSQLVHHSLALINRELCLQLAGAGHHVSIIPYEPSQFGPEADARFDELARRVHLTLPGAAEIHVRHQWPLNFQPPRQGRWVVIQPWEFGSVPKDWVPLLKDYVDELWVYTEVVREAYVAGGVPKGKIYLIPGGINPALFNPQARPMELATAKKFKFLFVGGTIHRKGPDILLNAYLERFRAADDVCLVIKDFGGQGVYQGQTLESKIREIQADQTAPEIIYLNHDLPPNQLPGLYTACNCLVHPYRGEGFGLPVLEAMACGLPVIVTEGGSTDEFVQDAFAFRIQAERRNIGHSVGSFELIGEGWLLEPNRELLGERMVEISRNPERARRMGVEASKYAHLNWTWEKAAEKVEQRLQALAERTDLPLRLQPIRPSESKPLEVPPAGRLGTLRKVHELLERKKYLKAWNAALEAIALRPFHPDAYLQMVDIALSADDEQQARVCADRLLSMTPEWDMAKKVHASLNTGQKLRKSKIKWTPLPPIRSKPRISVCLIAKNEEDFIGRCLASVKPIAHQIVVVDTGSSDRTVEIAKEHGAEVFQFAWNDNFSDARNAAHEHARGDWVLILDADEELPLESHENLWKDVAQSNALGLRIPICNVHESSNSVTYVPRLFRNAPALFFVGRVHEQIYTAVIARKADWNMEAKMGSAMINHYGYDPGLVRRRQKIQRNLRLMEKAVEEMPNEAALLMNYGLDLVNDGRLEEGLDKYRAAVRAMTPHRPESVLPEVRERLVTIFGVHLVKAGRFEELLELVTGKLAQDSGPTASMHFLAGVGFIKLERPSEAIGELKKAVEKKHVPTLSPPCHELDSAAPHHLLAECLAKQGESVAAEEHYKLSLQIDPKSAGLRHDYAHFLHRQDRSVDALKVLHGAVADGIADERIWHLGSFITNSRPELLEFGVEWTEEAVKFWPEHEAINWLRAEVLFKSGRLAEGSALMQRAGRGAEPSVQAAVILSALVNNESLTPIAPELEAAVSREFVGWYRRLLASGAQKVLAEINQRIAVLREALPSAAGMLEQAISEANKHVDS